MAETSRSHVTITLGRSGQVVKKAGFMSDAAFRDLQYATGSKRSVRDRLGSGEDAGQLPSKRQRGDGNRPSQSATTGLHDPHLGKNDLRFKLMQKNVLRRFQSDSRQNGVDLRETLSRPARPSLTNSSFQEKLPDRRDARYPMFETKRDGVFVKISSARSSDYLPQVESLRNSYSPWTLDRLRERSPDRVLRIPRNQSPPRIHEEIAKRPPIRAYKDVRTVSYTSKDIHVHDPVRPRGSVPYISKPMAATTHAKPATTRLPPPPPPSGIVLKSSYMGNEYSSVESFLNSLGLEKYAINFKVEEVDMAALRQMGDNDLKELGVPMGPRKKILLALLPRSKRPL